MQNHCRATSKSTISYLFKVVLPPVQIVLLPDEQPPVVDSTERTIILGGRNNGERVASLCSKLPKLEAYDTPGVGCCCSDIAAREVGERCAATPLLETL